MPLLRQRQNRHPHANSPFALMIHFTILRILKASRISVYRVRSRQQAQIWTHDVIAVRQSILSLSSMHNELLHSRIKHSFQDNHIKWSTGASTPRLRYAGLFAKPRGTNQLSRANSTMGYKAANWASSCSQRREDTVVGRILTLQQRRGWADLMTVFKILDVDSSLFFLPPIDPLR